MLSNPSSLSMFIEKDSWNFLFSKIVLLRTFSGHHYYQYLMTTLVIQEHGFSMLVLWLSLVHIWTIKLDLILFSSFVGYFVKMNTLTLASIYVFHLLTSTSCIVAPFLLSMAKNHSPPAHPVCPKMSSHTLGEHNRAWLRDRGRCLPDHQYKAEFHSPCHRILLLSKVP